MVLFKFKFMSGIVKTCTISKAEKQRETIGFIKAKAFSSEEYQDADVKFVRQGRLLKNEEMLKDIGKWTSRGVVMGWLNLTLSLMSYFDFNGNISISIHLNAQTHKSTRNFKT